jgi:hypothetical protein
MDDNGSDRGVIIDTGVLRINELRQPDEVDPDQQKRLHSYVKSDHAGHHYVQPQTGDQGAARRRRVRACVARARGCGRYRPSMPCVACAA